MPKAAEAIATAFKPNAKMMMFCRMTATVARASLTTSAIELIGRRATRWLPRGEEHAQ